MSESSEPSEPLAIEEIQELAEVFGVSVAAHHLLEDAGLPASQVPIVSVGNAEDFWREVGRRLAAGRLDYGRWRVLAEALRRYPHNRVFGTGKAAALPPPGGGHTGSGTGGGRASGYHVPTGRHGGSAAPDSGGPAGGEARPFTIVALDAKSYSKQTLVTHLDWRVAIRYFVQAAASRCQHPPETVIMQDSGDGVLAGFGPAVAKRMIVAEFVGRLHDEVRSYNRGRVPAARIRLRAAVHSGDTVVHDGGFAGDAAVVAARLVDAPPTRAVLDALPDVHLSVILSDQFYRDTVGQDLPGLDPRDYRREEVAIPKFTGIGWLHVPGWDLSVVPPTPTDGPARGPGPGGGPGGGHGEKGDGGPGPGGRPGGGPGDGAAGGSGQAPRGSRVPPPPGPVPPPGTSGRAREGRAREGRAREDGAVGDSGWDFLVSYAPTVADRRWAEWISWQLEDAGYGVHIEAWDGLAGSSIAGRVDRAVIGSKRTIVVLTSAYVHRGRHEADWHAAWMADRVLIPVRVEDFTPPGLLHGIVPVDLVGLTESDARERLLQRITQALMGRAKPEVQPPFPGQAR